MERTLALDILGDVTASRLEESEFLPPSVSYHSTRAHCHVTHSSNVGSGNDSRTSDESSSNVGDDGSIAAPTYQFRFSTRCIRLTGWA
jgi:hypothetical protein